MPDTSPEPPISFEQFAFVTAALSDGIRLEEVLEHQRIDPPTWQRAEPYWHRRIMATLNDEMPLVLQLDELQAEARTSWTRSLVPLDTELQAWLDFMRTLNDHDDPVAYLDELGITGADIGALAKLWTSRVAADPALQTELEALVAHAPQQVVVPRPARPTLPKPETHTTDGTGFYAKVDLDDALPFDEAEQGPVRIAPPLSTPLPATKTNLDATASVDGGVILDLPFKTPSDGASPEAPALSLDTYAALRVELAMIPAQADATLTRYGISADELQRLDALFQSRCDADAEWRARWEQAYEAHRQRWLARHGGPQ